MLAYQLLVNSSKKSHTLSSHRKQQESKLRSTGRRKGLHLLHHTPKHPDTVILQGVAVHVVIMIPDLHHRVDLLHHKVVPHISTKVVLPIISLHIRVRLKQHTVGVNVVSTKTVIDTEILHREFGHYDPLLHAGGGYGTPPLKLGEWIPHQFTAMTDMQAHHHHTAMTGAYHPRLMDMHLFPKEEGAVDIMVVDMAVTEVAFFLHLHHFIILSGAIEQLEAAFC